MLENGKCAAGVDALGEVGKELVEDVASAGFELPPAPRDEDNPAPADAPKSDASESELDDGVMRMRRLLADAERGGGPAAGSARRWWLGCC
jgi:hypothetical protein